MLAGVVFQGTTERIKEKEKERVHTTVKNMTMVVI